VSQMPDIAGGWPEEGAQYTPGAPMEPVQQQYPQAPQQHAQYQQAYPQQGYQEPQQQPQQQYGAAQPEYQQVPQQYQQPQQQYGGQQPGYPNQYQEQQQYQEQTAPQQAVYGEEEQSSVPSEFDHLFRDSSPQERRSISGRQPMVSGPGAAASPGFPQGPGQPQEAQGGPAAATALFTGPPAPGTVYEDRAPAGYAPDYGGGPFSAGTGGQDGGPGGRRTPLIIGGVVVVVAAVGLYLGLSGGGSGKSPTAAKSSTAATSPASTETAQQQADAVYQLVQQAKTLRSDISGGVDKLEACDVSGAQSEIDSTAQARASAAAAVAKLPVGKISGAAALLTDLQTAWQDSANSDQEYSKAAADFASGGCSKSAVKSDANFQAAQSASGSTANAKDAAASLWNQVMASYEPKITQSDL
jgi:hypothetical protein